MQLILNIIIMVTLDNVFLLHAINEKFLSLDSIEKPSIRDKIIVRIFKNYKKHERPTEESLKATTVRVNMHILAINSVDVINMAYNADFYLRQEWVDQRLGWNDDKQYENFNRSISISSMYNKLWLPDLFFRNGKEGFMYKMTMPNFLLRLKSNGDILYSQKITMRFSCQMHLSNFPMDSQQCDINIGSYGYTVDDLKFKWKLNESVTQSKDIQISEFNTPIEIKTLDCTDSSKTSTGTYSCLKVLFTLQRQLSSYLVSTYIPAMLIVMVSWLSFWISVEAVPARVTLGLLTLLGILTQNKGVSGTLPRVSYIKAIDIYIIACILFIIGAFTEFAIASNCIRRRRYILLDKHLRKVAYSPIDLNNIKINRNADFENEKLKTETSLISDKSMLRKRKRIRSYFSPTPVIKTNSGQTCTIVTLESKPRKSKSAHLRKQIKVIKNPPLSEEEELKRLLLTNYYNGNLIISNDNKFSDTYSSAHDEFNDDFNEIDDMFKLESLDQDGTKERSSTLNLCKDNLPEKNIHFESNLDAYSRFLFPAFFLIYNCFYWLYYLVIT